MAKEFTFDDLLKDPLRRVMKAEIDGLGVVTLTELTAAELEILNAEGLSLSEMEKQYKQAVKQFELESSTIDRDPSAGCPEVEALADQVAKADEVMVSRWAARFLAGKECSAEEITKITKNLSPSVRKEIYFRGLRFNVKDDSYREHIEKNS